MKMFLMVLKKEMEIRLEPKLSENLPFVQKKALI